MNGEYGNGGFGCPHQRRWTGFFFGVPELNVGALEFMPGARHVRSRPLPGYNKAGTARPARGRGGTGASASKQGILVQTIGQLGDDFDWKASRRPRETPRELWAFTAKLRGRFDDLMPMGVGACSICEECTYPDAPCRYPERAVPPMEAYGLFVSKVCTLSGAKYNNGPKTITFTSCYLF